MTSTKLKSKKILITGASGFLGTYLSELCKDYGADIYGVDILPPNNPYLFTEFLTQSITSKNFSDFFQSYKFDYVFHLAGSASVPYSIENPYYDFCSLVPPTLHLITLIGKYNSNTHLVSFSSAAVYGNPKSLPIIESAEKNPISPYGKHKALNEEMLKFYCEFLNVKVSILRIFSAYGPGLKKQLFWDVLEKYKQNPDKIELFGTGMETRDFIHAYDVVSAGLFIALNSNEKLFNIYNIGSGKEISIADAVSDLFYNLREEDKPKIVFIGKQRGGDPIRWRADISKLEEIGFTSSYQLKQGLSSYFNWHNNIDEKIISWTP